MKKIASLLVISALFVAAPVVSSAQPDQIQAGFADLVEKLSPAVVNISTTQKVKGAQGYFGMPFEGLPNTPEFEPFRQFFDRFGGQMQQAPEREVFSLGSGFIIDAEGYVITNNHVVAEADEVTVTLSDDRKFNAEIIGRDPKTDLALLKIKDSKPFPYVPMGDSDAMRVGDWVIAIGNPFGLGGSVTQGIISARQRSINAGPFDDFLQTDAPINRGNSGGPLFNTKGEVIGINSAIFSPSGGSVGIGFAIPTALAKPIISQLKAQGHVVRGWLGVKIQEVNDEIAESVGLDKAKGALIMDVSEGSPAAKAGLKAGDIVLSFDSKEIKEMRFLPRLVAETKIGNSVPVGYWREGKLHTTQVVVAKLDDEEERPVKASKDKKEKTGNSQTVLGMELVPLNAALKQNFSVRKGVDGLAILDVASGSEAAKRGIRGGDVIVAVNNIAVASVADMQKLVENARKLGRKFVLITIARENEVAMLTLPVAEK
ncbi:MAG: DegQ family serine endoprotease [Alphaproteobacteria bacterium]